ncbi:MAG: hypothetical protein Kow0090_13430 [Myxococcota bacterium]
MESSVREDSLSYRLGWFIALRWLAAFGVLPGLFVFTRFFKLEANWNPFVLITIVMLFLNAAYAYYLEKSGLKNSTLHPPPPSALRFAHLQVFIDLVLLTVIIYLLGSITYPFYLFYIFHIIISALLLSPKAVFFYSTLSLALFTASAYLEAIFPSDALSKPHYTAMLNVNCIYGFISILLPLISGFFLAAFIAVSITASLRKRQSEVERLTEELSLQNKKLELHNEARERFMSVAFHDLKAPLAAADGYLHILINDIGHKSEEEKKTMLNRMQNRIQQLTAFIRELREYSEIELGEKSAEYIPLDIREIALEALDINSQLAADKGIELNHSIPIELPKVLGVRIRALELLNNIISNAIKFTDKGSVSVRATANEKGILFSIQDTGPGITDEELPKIFDEFYRGGESRTTTEGSGLGLAISKKIVTEMGGSIWAESEHGKGTVFYILLPACKEAEQPPNGKEK